MALPCCQWRTVTGVRRTSPADVLSCDVFAVAPPSEIEVDRVEFAITVNGTPHSTRTVTAPALRFPNYSDAISPLPGVASGMAGAWLWGTTLLMSDFAAGTITVVATCYTVAGNSRVVPMSAVTQSITIYNDSDGVDRRPNTNVRYVSGLTGNDANPGTIGSPKATVTQAIISGKIGTECGGLRIVVLDGEVGLQAFGAITCTGHHWLDVFFSDGVKVVNAFPFFVTGNGTGTVCNVRFRGTGSANKARFWRTPGAVDVGSSHTRVWVDGMGHSSQYWNGPGTMSIKFILPSESGPVSDAMFSMTGGSSWERYASCSSIDGWVAGTVSWNLIHDFVYQDVWGSVLANGMSYAGACNVFEAPLQYNGHPSIRGIVGTTHPFIVQTTGTGKMRLQCTSGLTHPPLGEPFDFALSMQEIANVPQFALRLQGFNGTNNGVFVVLGSGNSGGFPYVDLDYSGHTIGTQPASAEVATVWGPSSPFGAGATIDVHPDLLPINVGNNLQDICYQHVSCIDVRNKLGLFFSTPSGPGFSVTRWAMFDVAMSAKHETLATLPSLLGGAPMIDCVWASCTLNTQLFNIGACTNCLFADLIGYGLTLPTNGVNGNVLVAVQASAGASWFAAWPGDAPFNYAPAPGNLNTASATHALPVELRWPGATGDSRGCLRCVGTHDWTVAVGVMMSSPAPATGTGAAPGFSVGGDVVMSSLIISEVSNAEITGVHDEEFRLARDPTMEATAPSAGSDPMPAVTMGTDTFGDVTMDLPLSLDYAAAIGDATFLVDAVFDVAWSVDGPCVSPTGSFAVDVVMESTAPTADADAGPAAEFAVAAAFTCDAPADSPASNDLTLSLTRDVLMASSAPRGGTSAANSVAFAVDEAPPPPPTPSRPPRGRGPRRWWEDLPAYVRELLRKL